MALALGVDVGGTKVLAALVDTTDPTRLLRSHRVPTPDGPAALDAIVGAAREVLEGASSTGSGPVVGVGVGLPGLVGPEGLLFAAPHLPGLVERPLRRTMAEALGLPVVIDNDANCAAWAEVVAGAGRGAADVVVVTLGTGIGGGLVVDGSLWHGAHGAAGEPGHMVVDRGGVPCPCGRRGCWERYCSGTAMARLGAEAVERGEAPGIQAAAGGPGAEVEGEHVVAAARAGDPGARAVLDEFADWLGLGLANLVTLLDPELVIVGGGLADEHDLYLERARHVLAAEVLGGRDRPPARVEAATLGSDAGVIGAALLAVPPPAPAFAAR